VQAAEYLASRGINEATREKFAIGFAPREKTALLRSAQSAGFSTKELSDVGLVSRPRGGGPQQDRFRRRLMLPVCDVRGRVLGFGARKLGNARVPKYVNSPSGAMYCKSELLYGAHHARAVAAKTGIVIVVEGYIDALAMHQAGIVNTVALMGTSITEQQIGRLKQLAPTVVLMLDGDDAGAGAVLRAGVLARPLGLEVLVATLPEGTDPADLLQQREGAPIVRELVADAGAFARSRVQHHLERADIGTAEAKDRLIHELRDVFVDIQPSVVREDLITLAGSRDIWSYIRRCSVRGYRVRRVARGKVRRGMSAAEPTQATTAHGGNRGLLLDCIADPEIAARLPSGDALVRLFPDALQRRAAEHIRMHAHDPAAGLPDDDDVVALITSLLTAPVAGSK
jgi:DNA primase